MNSYFQPNFGTEAPLFVIDHTWVPLLTKAQLLQGEQQLYILSSSDLAQEIFIPVRFLEDYSNEAHQSAIAVAIKLSKTLQEREFQFDHDSSESEDDYGHVMNPTKAKIVFNDFLQALPECPPIHWPSQMLNDPQLGFCPCCPIAQPWRGKMKVSIHPNHGCKTRSMTPMQLINHLEKEGDSTHKAILVYLNKLATFQ